MSFEAKLTTRDGEDFDETLGWPTVGVVVGEGDIELGQGRTVPLAAGVWRYIADETEIGPWKTVVIFTAPNCMTQFDRSCGEVEPPTLPPDWANKTAISRADFLGLVAGMKPRAEYADWLKMLTQADPIPLTDPIKQGLARAYPQLFK